MDKINLLSANELKLSLQNFRFIDYTIFAIILLASTGIGIYFGFFEKKKNNVQTNNCEEEYLLAGRKMTVIPVTLSLIASYISGISILGYPSETYVYGTQNAFELVLIFSATTLAWFVYLPIYCELKLTSIFKYFELRFDKRMRMLGSLINVVGTFLWLPLVVYMPALVFNQVSGVGIHVVTPIICFVCMFYTCIGGMKAVIWTDVLQSGIMFGIVLLIIIKGTIDVGGIEAVLDKNYQSGRILLPELSFDPRVRLSIFSVVFSGVISWTDSVCCRQMMMQRYLSVPSLQSARKVAVYFSFGAVLLMGCCSFNGMVLYAYYHDCDPLTTGLAKENDQLLPLFFMNILGNVPGLPGIFVAGIFSAALSSLSSGLNSLSAIVLEDFIKPNFSNSMTEKTLAVTMRLIVIVFGCLAFGMVFIVQHLGMVFQLTSTLSSVSSGPLFSLFIMGAFLPWINGKSALTGGVVAFIIMTIICVLKQISNAQGYFKYRERPVSVEGCDYTFKLRNSTTTFNEYEVPMKIEHISFMWYSTIGAIIAIVFSNLATLIFGRVNPKEVNIKLIAPFLRKYYENHDIATEEELNYLAKNNK